MKKNTKNITIVILAVILGFISIGSFIGYKKFTIKDFIVYQESNSLDYSVCFKQPNDFYTEECLPKSINNYVTQYINYININFDYKLELNKDVENSYKYRVDAELTIFDSNNVSYVMNEKTYNLVSEKTVSVGDAKKISLSELVKINYDEYNNFVTSYKRSSNIGASANLKVVLYVDTFNKYAVNEKPVNTSQSIAVNIPLNETTIQLKTDYNPTYKSPNIEIGNNESKASILLITSPVAGVLSVLLIIYIILLAHFKYKKMPIYDRFIKELKNDYDSDITNVTNLIDNDDEDTYEYLDVPSFKELYEIIKINTDKKIIWNEKKYYDAKGRLSNRISWFFIFVSDQKVMRFIVDEKTFTKSYNENSNVFLEYRG